MADILVDAFAPSKDYKYTHQFRDQYPDEDRRCWRDTMHRLLSERPTQSWWRVLSVADRTAQKGTRAVSLAAWDFMGPPNETFWSMAAAGGECSKQRDVNATRQDHLVKQYQTMMKKYIRDAYESQAYLSGLATHPNWDGHGFAAAHLHWGLALAHEKGMPATLIASPVGHPLYRSFGYEDVKNVTIELLDGLGTVWCEVMVLKSP